MVTRLEELMKIAKDAERFGSIAKYMTPDMMNIVLKDVQPSKPSVLFRRPVDQSLLNRPYGLPSDGSPGMTDEEWKILNTPYGL